MLIEANALKYALSKTSFSSDFQRLQKILETRYLADIEKKNWVEVDKYELKAILSKAKWSHQRVVNILNLQGARND